VTDDDDDDDDGGGGNDDEYCETHHPPIQRVPGALSAGYCIRLTNDNHVQSEIERGER